MKEIIFLNPTFKEMIWGGDRLKEEFGYDVKGNQIGECWAVSAHKNGDCMVNGGIYAGKFLSELWKEHRELFGGLTGNEFPLLIKIIDAKSDLSIQVHPDDEYAAKHENGSYGKTECWYILDCDEDAEIVIGHNAKSKADLKKRIENKEWKDLIRVLPIKKGDFFQIYPGTVHAIKAGTMILETQQNSDITYRLYDYDRLQNGKPRELHIEKSIDVITCPHEDSTSTTNKVEFLDATVEELIHCDYYTVNKIELKGTKEFVQDNPFLILSILEGEGTIDGQPIKKGDHFILPSGYGSYELSGNMMIITSYTEAK